MSPRTILAQYDWPNVQWAQAESLDDNIIIWLKTDYIVLDFSRLPLGQFIDTRPGLETQFDPLHTSGSWTIENGSYVNAVIGTHKADYFASDDDVRTTIFSGGGKGDEALLVANDIFLNFDRNDIFQVGIDDAVHGLRALTRNEIDDAGIVGAKHVVAIELTSGTAYAQGNIHLVEKLIAAGEAI